MRFTLDETIIAALGVLLIIALVVTIIVTICGCNTEAVWIAAIWEQTL